MNNVLVNICTEKDISLPRRLGEQKYLWAFSVSPKRNTPTTTKNRTFFSFFFLFLLFFVGVALIINFSPLHTGKNSILPKKTRCVFHAFLHIQIAYERITFLQNQNFKSLEKEKRKIRNSSLSRNYIEALIFTLFVSSHGVADVDLLHWQESTQYMYGTRLLPSPPFFFFWGGEGAYTLY